MVPTMILTMLCMKASASIQKAEMSPGSSVHSARSTSRSEADVIIAGSG